MEAKDIRDWVAFAIGVIVPAVLGIALLGAEFRQAPSIVQAAFGAVAALFVVAAAMTVHFWRQVRALKSRLGLAEICDRDSAPPLHTVYRSVKHSYRWHGLSAVNELVGQTEVQAAILKQSHAGAEYSFVLADPRDWIRMEEQRRWENEAVRPVGKMIENIEGSRKVIKELHDQGARIALLTAARLPSFRIVEIDEDRIEVTNYSQGSCGYGGAFLVLKRPTSGDGLLYNWFRRAADLERKNAVLDYLYYEITKGLMSGLEPKALADSILKDASYDGLRHSFDKQFKWPLRGEDLEKCVAFVSQRLS